MRRAGPLVFAVIVLAMFVPGVLADAGGPLVATVQGPGGLAPSQAALYNLTISGGPGGPVNYSVTYYLTGANTTGAKPVKDTPGTISGNRTRFQLNVTSPGVEEELTLVVTVSATPPSGAAENTTTNYPITVLKPVVLSATFHNSGTTKAVNVTVRWYLDDALVGTSLIGQIAANGDATVTLNYVPLGLAAGEHTVKVTADLDHDGVINPSRGEVVTSTLFYNQVAPPSTGWLLLIGMAVFIPVFLGVVAVRRRGQR